MNTALKRNRSAWLALCAVGACTLALSAQAASFDCAKAGTQVEKLVCADAELSKLDEELNTAYKAALQDGKQATSIRQAQKQWMKERNGCSDVSCLRSAYLKRNEQLRVVSGTPTQPANVAATEKSVTSSGKAEGENSSDPSPFKGEYILMRGLDPVCKRFKDNLNRFRKLDFDQCNPRLSDKFPEFSRPYQWKEIPLDMALAEKAIRSTTDYDSYGAKNNISGLEYERKLSEDRWQQWKKDIDPYRAAGTAHMWLAKIDIDGDGVEDTLLRMVPGGRSRIDPERLSLWTCDYNIGELYVIEAGNPPMAAAFNKSAWSASDIIHFAEDNHYYLLTWEAGLSSTNGWFNQGVPSVGGTRGVTIRTLYRGKEDWKNNYSGNTPATICLIDWVPTGRYIPAAKPKHIPDTH